MRTICSKDISFVVLVLVSVINAPSRTAALQDALSQPEQSQHQGERRVVMPLQETRHVEKAADRFVGRFRERLDFGAVFDEMFVTDAIQRLRKAGFFESSGIIPQLVERLDDATLKRIYKAFMNYYYLKAVYDLGVGKNESTPPEVAAVIKASKFFNLLSDTGSVDAPDITTREELEQFVVDLSNIAAMYKKRLPRNVFDSPTYNTSLKAINMDKRSTVRIRDGYEDFGVKEGVKVYEVEQDIFIIFFVEEDGELKVLTLGMGN